MTNKFSIIIPFYNASEFIERSIMSALTQKYDNFKIILINDCSTDNSEDIIKNIVNDNTEKITYIKNEKRMGAMYNHTNAVMNYCDEQDIVIQLDGDDWLNSKKVLEYINEFYEKESCWMMYGQAQYFSGRKGNARPYISKDEFDNKRKLDFYVSHIRTFRAFTFHEIKNQDPDFLCFKDQKGNWYSMSCDVAMMYPILEICGYEKVKYNDKPLYIYNDSNSISDVKVDFQLQYSIHQEILRKKPFKQIKK